MLKFWRSRKKSSRSDKAAPRCSPASPSSAHAQEAVPSSSSSSSGSTTTPSKGLRLSPLEGDTVKEGGTGGQTATGGARRGSSPRLDEIRPVERAPSEEAIAERPRKVLVDRNGREQDAPALLLSVDEAKGPVRRDSSHSHGDDTKRNISPRSASQLSVVRDARSRNTARSYTSQSHEAEEGDRDPTQIYGKFMAYLSLIVDCLALTSVRSSQLRLLGPRWSVPTWWRICRRANERGKRSCEFPSGSAPTWCSPYS